MSLIVSILLAGAATAAPSATPAAARVAVQRYYAALDRRDYRTAYRLWDRGGQASGKTYAQFVRGFATTRHTRVTAGVPMEPEGAAGSSYIRVPVTVRATLRNGTAQTFSGSYTLRRVNDIDGSTPEQRQWHLNSASLRRR
ncbi:hypothetical protein KZ810_10695 [Sphingomonas sp. RHCKR47]|uniref:hypothetical protein n=1 Tax=Sphingomonas citricola TaxID=2862498 RepID=UPI001CA57DC3|nr:hypothetical protein [Sphingomonas citricola]MBW6523963.1 hypothetical protein [Sphingomonas citricola]